LQSFIVRNQQFLPENLSTTKNFQFQGFTVKKQLVVGHFLVWLIQINFKRQSSGHTLSVIPIFALPAVTRRQPAIPFEVITIIITVGITPNNSTVEFVRLISFPPATSMTLFTESLLVPSIVYLPPLASGRLWESIGHAEPIPFLQHQ
jgi:hypothetical protein